MYEYSLAKTKEEFKTAANLFKEYAEWLKIDLCFQNFNEEIINLQQVYSFKTGGIVLCKTENTFIGCAAIRKINEEACELKRMWVQLPHQKKGIGEKLLQECIELARKFNYKEIRLDTLQRLQPAIRLYKKYKFEETTAYYENPNADVVYMKKIL